MAEELWYILIIIMEIQSFPVTSLFPVTLCIQVINEDGLHLAFLVHHELSFQGHGSRTAPSSFPARTAAPFQRGSASPPVVFAWFQGGTPRRTLHLWSCKPVRYVSNRLEVKTLEETYTEKYVPPPPNSFHCSRRSLSNERIKCKTGHGRNRNSFCSRARIKYLCWNDLNLF